MQTAAHEGSYEFVHPSADRLIAIIAQANRPSQRVAEKLGLALERQTGNQGRWPSPQLIYATSLRQRRAPDGS